MASATIWHEPCWVPVPAHLGACDLAKTVLVVQPDVESA